MDKNKIMNICIIFLLVITLILIGAIGITFYNISVEEDNKIIQEFSIELLKGNKTIGDIENLNTSTKIKDVLKNYYNETFYNENDTIIVCDNISELDNIVSKVEEVASDYYVDGIFNYNDYYNGLLKKGILSWNDLNGIEEVEEKSDVGYYSLYHPDIKTNIQYTVEDNKLCVKVKDLLFDAGSCSVNYKGFVFDIYRDALDKKITSEVQKSSKYQSIKEVSSNYVKGVRKTYYTDELDNSYLITFEYRFGKIINVIF